VLYASVWGMSFFHSLAQHDPLARNDPLLKAADKGLYGVFGAKTPPPTPPAPNPNDAANASQSLTDQMRMRRGLMANIYAGAAGNQQPVTGKTALGT